MIPCSEEEHPLTHILFVLQRIAWDITGKHEAFHDLSFMWPTDYRGTGAIKDLTSKLQYRYSSLHTSEDSCSLGFSFSSSFVVPASDEINPLVLSMFCLFRIDWDIRGEHRFCIGHYANEYKNSGVFGFTSAISRSHDAPNNVRANYEYMTIKFSNNFVAPCSGEEKPLTQSFFVLQRIAWDISGELKGLIGNGTQSTGVFIRYAYEDWSVTSGTSGYKIDGSFKSSRVIPAVKDQPENIPILQALSLMIRVTWSSVKCALKKERFH